MGRELLVNDWVNRPLMEDLPPIRRRVRTLFRAINWPVLFFFTIYIAIFGYIATLAIKAALKWLL